MDHKLNYMLLSRGALWQNAQTICGHVGVPVIGVVKCDGYGVSVPEAARAWQQAGVDTFAVSKPQEALELRKAGFREDILLLSPVADPEMLNLLAEHKVVLTVTGLDTAHFYMLYSSRFPLRVHVAVDTGMGRFGVRWTDLAQLKAIYSMDCFQFEGIFSHFARAFEQDFRMTRLQLRRFLDTTEALRATGCPIGLRHIANSCAALRFPETRLDAVRIGSALVGRVCGGSPVPLEPVGAFRAQVVDCKTLLPGDTTGYAGLCRVRRYTRAAVVAVGREDGLGYLEAPGALSGWAGLASLLRLLRRSLRRPCALYCGQPLPLVGRVGQQYTLFDATGTGLRPGDYVTLELPQLFPHRTHSFLGNEPVTAGQSFRF